MKSGWKSLAQQNSQNSCILFLTLPIFENFIISYRFIESGANLEVIPNLSFFFGNSDFLCWFLPLLSPKNFDGREIVILFC